MAAGVVGGLVNGTGGGLETVYQTASTTATIAAATVVFNGVTTGAGFTATLPSIASFLATSGQTANAGSVRVLHVHNTGGNNLTLDGNGAETIDGAATLVMNANTGVTLACVDGVGWFTV